MIVNNSGELGSSPPEIAESPKVSHTSNSDSSGDTTASDEEMLLAHYGDGRPAVGEQLKHKMPKGVIFIWAMCFFERFAFYGIRAILAIYLRNILGFSEDLSTTVFHSYIFLSLTLPMVGGFIADSWLGKYRTIVTFSSVAFTGYAILTLAALRLVPLRPGCSKGGTNRALVRFSHLSGTYMIPLSLVAIGSGFIKACLASFGADQFKMPEQGDEVGHYFSVAYICIALGSSFSLLLIPAIHTGFSCFNENTCYPLAFATPALAMLVSLGTRQSLNFVTCNKDYYTDKVESLLTPPKTSI